MKEKAAAREAALKLTTGIAEIAVDAVQVSVDPCAVRVVAVHYNLVPTRLCRPTTARPAQAGARLEAPYLRDCA